jgi:alkylation response protein AidB-like acyl-CoA dehydrogenase
VPHPYGIELSSCPWFKTLERVRGVAAEHAAAVDAEARFPTEALAQLASSGLLGLTVPAALGGLGEGPRAFATVAEELGMACGSTAMVFVMHVAGTQAIAASSTLGQREALLREIAAGRHLTTLALSEKGSRSHFWAPVSQLVAAGEGFTTSAHKSWVTSAGQADSYVSTAQRPGAGSPLESTLYLVRKGRAGVRVAGRFDGLGLRGNDSVPVELSGYAVSASDLVTAQGQGASCKLEVILPWFAMGSAAMSHGICRAAVSSTASHLSGHRFEHLGVDLRSLPNLRARLAQMATRTEQSRALLGLTMTAMERHSASTPLFVLQSRVSALQAAVEVTDLGMKAAGGAAFSRHLPLEPMFRDARAGWVMAPTVDHLEDFIGKALTGLPLF